MDKLKVLNRELKDANKAWMWASNAADRAWAAWKKAYKAKRVYEVSLKNREK